METIHNYIEQQLHQFTNSNPQFVATTLVNHNNNNDGSSLSSYLISLSQPEEDLNEEQFEQAYNANDIFFKQTLINNVYHFLNSEKQSERYRWHYLWIPTINNYGTNHMTIAFNHANYISTTKQIYFNYNYLISITFTDFNVMITVTDVAL